MRILYAHESDIIWRDAEIEDECESLYKQQLIPRYTFQYASLANTDFTEWDVVFVLFNISPRASFEQCERFLSAAKNNSEARFCLISAVAASVVSYKFENKLDNIYFGLLDWIDYLERSKSS
jgi:hypothetical protein